MNIALQGHKEDIHSKPHGNASTNDDTIPIRETDLKWGLVIFYACRFVEQNKFAPVDRQRQDNSKSKFRL